LRGRERGLGGRPGPGRVATARVRIGVSRAGGARLSVSKAPRARESGRAGQGRELGRAGGRGSDPAWEQGEQGPNSRPPLRRAPASSFDRRDLRPSRPGRKPAPPNSPASHARTVTASRSESAPPLASRRHSADSELLRASPFQVEVHHAPWPDSARSNGRRLGGGLEHGPTGLVGTKGRDFTPARDSEI
jgi:hypothetical protein